MLENSEISLPEKLTSITDTLDQNNIPYAFGGAIALGYFKEPRATHDLDVNVFIPVERQEELVNALSQIFDITDKDQFIQEISTRDQGRTRWGNTPVDVFFMSTEFHETMASRIRSVDFHGREIKVISPEDLIVCKVLYDRPQDWVDIRGVLDTQGADLDIGYISAWLAYLVEVEDSRVQRFSDLI